MAVRSWELPEFPEMDRKSFWKPLQDFRLQVRAAVLSFTKEEKKIRPFSWLEKHRRKSVMQVFTLHLCQKTVWEWDL